MPALDIKQLSKIYPNGFHALKSIDLQVNEGDFFALLGPNGAGKSTSINLISQLSRKTSGQVKIFGDDIDTAPMAARRHIGLVPQEINCDQFETVLNVAVNQAGYYGIRRNIAYERAEKYLNALNLWDKRFSVFRTLSGGMKRRLMIVRALIHEPRVLLLDEPTAGVDIELRRSMWKFIQQINQQGITIILTTHYLEEAEQLCRNIAIINQGNIVENTSMKQLLKRLEKEVFILDLEAPCDELPQLKHYESHKIDDMTFEVIVSKKDGLSHLFQQLSEHGIQVCSLRNKHNRLEELFVNLIGEHRA